MKVWEWKGGVNKWNEPKKDGKNNGRTYHINIDNDDSKESINQSMRGDGLEKKKEGEKME